MTYLDFTFRTPKTFFENKRGQIVENLINYYFNYNSKTSKHSKNYYSAYFIQTNHIFIKDVVSKSLEKIHFTLYCQIMCSNLMDNIIFILDHNLLK